MRPREHGEGIITAIALGGVLIIIGLLFLITPDLGGKIGTFFSDITTKSFIYLANTTSTISLPVPADPASHSILYMAVAQFCIGVGILQILILALRAAVRSRIGRIAETVGNLVFWLGAGYLVTVFLNSSTTYREWFVFWSSLLILLGVSIMVRGIILFARRRPQIKT